MKKITKSIIAMACVVTLGAGISAMAGCGEKDLKGAYGLVHGAGYVGYANVTVDADKKVTDAVLQEMCFPTQVKAPADVPAEDKVTDGKSDYYKVVSYNQVVLTYNAGAGYKTADGKTLKEFFADEAACKEYYNAVVNGKVTVTVGDKKLKDVMTQKTLLKEENGYWPVEGQEQTQWVVNRNAYVKYVKDNGVSDLLLLGKYSKKWGASETLVSGATWSDGNSVKAGSFSYSELLVKAYNLVTGYKTGIACGLTNGGDHVGYSVVTTDKDDKVVDVKLTEFFVPSDVYAEKKSGADADAARAALTGSYNETDYVIDVQKAKWGTSQEATVYYKKVTYGTVTLTYDATAHAYKDANGKTFKELLNNEAACRVYVGAVLGGSVSVVKTGTDGTETKDATIMTKKALCKDDNGYWPKDGASQWKKNRDATVKYVKENGVANLLDLKLDATSKTYKDGSIDTGATWSNLIVANPNGFVSYAQLIKNAFDARK